MFKKVIEKRQKLNDLRKECFDARKKLVVSCDEKILTKSLGCIKLGYTVGFSIANPWVSSVEPEKVSRIVESKVSYCENFDPQYPTLLQCTKTTCPMYNDYLKYVQKARALALEKSK